MATANSGSNLEVTPRRVRVPRLVDPASRLPLELLVEVFRWCDTSLDYRGLRLPDGLYTRRAPWLLTHVCRRWRSVTISSPQLWRKVTVNLSLDEGDDDEDEDEFTEGIYELTRLFLERSAQSQIAVVLTGTHPQPVLDLIMSASDRWDDLSIHAESHVIRELSTIAGRLPKLTRLELVRSEYDEEETSEDAEELDFFSVAPRLRDVTFRYDPLFSIPVPWSQLTRFATSYAELRPILDALRELVNLETLTLDRQGDEGNMEQLPSASLPCLCELTITTGPDEEGNPGLLLDHLSLPALVRLTLECEDSTICPHTAALISRSGCHLRSFKLSHYDTLDTPLLGVLALTPDLTELDLCGTEATDVFLTRLTRVPPALAPEIIPRLESLLLRARFKQELLVRLLESRAPALGSDEPGLICSLQYIGLQVSLADIEPGIGHRLTTLNLNGAVLR
ncbi:hypothetical protein C8R45DRAFT_1213740 [Mycena sanguinolenta]|nr:hypothetical protein C8R45DRAFT_1213740 [Mycena sanguinolenta]